MIRLGVGLPVALGLFVLGQAEAASSVFPGAEILTGGGAVAVLAWILWYLVTKELPAGRQSAAKESAEARQEFTNTLDKMAERHERLEIQRHEDSQKIESALNNLAVTCARTQSRLLEAKTDGEVQGG